MSDATQLTYLDFDLAIEAVASASTGSASAQTYRARVLNSPVGQAMVDFTLPFNPYELENYILKIGRTRRTVRSLNSQEGQAARDFGERLYNAVFKDEVRDALRRSLDKADGQADHGLRIRLRLGDAPALLDLPWEYLYDPTLRRFFCHSTTTPLVRYPQQPRPVTPLGVTLPLQVLVLIANPSDVAALDIEGEWRKIEAALGTLRARGLVQLTRLENGTLAALQRQLRQGRYHIFHFVGHGGLNGLTGERVLYLEDERGRAHAVGGDYLGTLLRDHRSLRLALLNACEGARATTNDPFAGIAQQLVHQGIPAIIAMQFEITDGAALILAQEFYGALADGYPVESALAEARKAIFVAGNDVEWGTPVLYSRANDGLLFNLTSLPEPVEGNDNSELAEWKPFSRDAKPVKVATIETPERVLDAVVNRIGDESGSQNKQSPISPSRQVDDVHSSAEKNGATSARWLKPRVLASLLVCLFLLGTLGFWSQLADIFGPKANGELNDSLTVTVATPAQDATAIVPTVVALNTTLESTTTLRPDPNPTAASVLVDMMYVRITNQYGVNARISPSTNAEIVDLLEVNEVYLLKEIDEDWLQVAIGNGTLAWISDEFAEPFTQQKSLENANIELSILGLLPLTPQQMATNEVLMLIAVMTATFTPSPRPTHTAIATFTPTLHPTNTMTVAPTAISMPADLKPGDAAAGKAVFLTLCFACHGADGKGISGLGKDMTTSEFIAGKSDAELFAFVRTGRPIGDPLNTTGVAMPPSGGNPALTDQELMNIIAFIRTMNTMTVAPTAISMPADLNPGDAAAGKAVFMTLCFACHGREGKGIPGLGKDMTTSEFIASKSDAELFAFVRTGRPIGDPLNTTGVAMPPSGGNPNLTDQDLMNIIAFIRTIHVN